MSHPIDANHIFRNGIVPNTLGVVVLFAIVSAVMWFGVNAVCFLTGGLLGAALVLSVYVD